MLVKSRGEFCKDFEHAIMNDQKLAVNITYTGKKLVIQILPNNSLVSSVIENFKRYLEKVFNLTTAKLILDYCETYPQTTNQIYNGFKAYSRVLVYTATENKIEKIEMLLKLKGY